ncbi:DUF4433 domain-containing protein [Amycolatopsis alba]|uniref:DUF4433 domain-containing protein n=1 Tax=Amycolatopsis alba DSM 44262 TaxID=1125972 RepID=A0A229RCY2_AMYAL|nr:DUF4433 domain-containing protein [Amycolatopsis alba]OXM44533.1 DUF4433 domain-containing protein [Amycolatopsis alba DSM 44262]
MKYFPDSGFASASSAGPQREQPRDWLVWHFTHLENLEPIVKEGHLLCPERKLPAVSVALHGVKERRRHLMVAPDDQYPARKSVADHVPFYIAARSPMLFTVTRGHDNYSGGDTDLVFLGLSIGAIEDSGVTWCASDSNAACTIVEFSRKVDNIGQLVDYDLLCQKWWGKTPDDQNRPSRRAAEVLVLDTVPLEMITHVVAKTQVTLDKARDRLTSVGGVREYHVLPSFYYN